MRISEAKALVCLAAALGLAWALPVAAEAARRAVAIKAVLGSTEGADSEYVELRGPPGAPLDGLSLIVVEGEDAGQIGDISYRLDLGAGDAIGGNGAFLAANARAAQTYDVTPNRELPADAIENGSYTVALVETASLSGGAVAGGEVVLDALGVASRAMGSIFFDAPVVGPDGAALPAGAARMPGRGGLRLLSYRNGAPNDPVAGAGVASPLPGEIEGAPTLISAIQGRGAASGMIGRTVVVEALVTGDFQTGDADTFRDLGGVFLMEERADFDADPRTSEGIFADDSNVAPKVDVAAGDRIRVLGRVAERSGKTILELSALRIEERAAAPDPRRLAVVARLPALADRGALESMLVTFDEPLTWIESFEYEEFGVGTLAAGGPVHPHTQMHPPDRRGNAAHLKALADRTILIDDGSDRRRAEGAPLHAPDGALLSLQGGLRMGQPMALTAIVDHAFGAFRLRLPAGVAFAPTPESAPRPPRPGDVGSAYRIASLNVLNYFTTRGRATASGLAPRGARTASDHARQAAKIVSIIEAMDADVVALSEIENDFSGPGSAIADLVGRLNAVAGRERWAWVDPGRALVGGDAIAVGFLYDRETTRVAPGTRPAILTDEVLRAGGLHPGNPVFDGPGTSRAPLAVTFEATGSGGRFTAVALHLKSKGSVSRFGANADRRDGQGNNVEARMQAAAAVVAWLGTDPTGSGDADRVLLGDLNSYAREDPVRHLEARGFVNLVARAEGLGASSYRFGGQVGTLDYAMANADLAGQVTGATIWNVNAAEPVFFDYAARGTYVRIARPADQGLFAGAEPARASDHDPVIVGLDLRREKPVVTARRGDPPAGRAAADAGAAVPERREGEVALLEASRTGRGRGNGSGRAGAGAPGPDGSVGAPSG